MLVTPLSMLYPTTVAQSFTPGVFMMISSAFLATSSVRCREAASGSCTPAKRYPWSSSGRKLVATDFPSSPVSTTTPTRKRRLSPLFRIARLQVLTYPSVARPKNRLNPS